LLLQARRAVVDGGIEAELSPEIVHFLLAAGDAYHAAALDLGDLPRRRADRPCRRGYRERFAGLWLADVQKPSIGCQSWHAEHPKRSRNRRNLRIELAEPASIGNRIVLPAAKGQHDVANGEFRVVRSGHLAHRSAAKRLTDNEGRHIGFGLAHASAHVGI